MKYQIEYKYGIYTEIRAFVNSVSTETFDLQRDCRICINIDEESLTLLKLKFSDSINIVLGWPAIVYRYS